MNPRITQKIAFALLLLATVLVIIPIGMIVVTGIILIMVIYVGFGKFTESMQIANNIASAQAAVTAELGKLVSHINALMGVQGYDMLNLSGISLPLSPLG